MKRKIGTTLDEALYRRAKDTARRQDRSLNALIEEALERFLDTAASSPSVVAETWGTFKVSPKALRAILDEDLYGAQ
ncbi:MAG: hypothetical protein HY660_05745 [Armatimonadetes bacterium]|nr:hypothetical protein [Armatimonadota bacterium]